MSKPKISVLLPTRKRVDAVIKSLSSLILTATDQSAIEIMIAYDADDEESRAFFADQWVDFIGQSECSYQIFETERFGYTRLNEYVNLLGENAQGDWVFFWNDDSLMLTDGWDQEVLKHDPTALKLLRIPCQNMNHPFALMPIIPRAWIDVFGCISPVSHSDWWIFNVCYPNQRVIDLGALFYHDRADVTGGNNDETFAERSYSADGQDPTNLYDYVHPHRQHELREWIKRLSEYNTNV